MYIPNLDWKYLIGLWPIPSKKYLKGSISVEKGF